MKRLIILTLIITLIFPSASFAKVAGFEGGVRDDSIYKEVIFITGQPILVEGSIDVRENISKDTINTTINYNLENIELGIRVVRRVRFKTEIYNKQDTNQRVAHTTIDSFSERITIGGDRYNLGDYQFSQSIVYDDTPAVSFYSGNLSSKKIYYINGDMRRNEGKVVVETNSDTIVGYQHHWGASETYILNQDITSERLISYNDEDGERVQETVKWDGGVTLKLSSTDRKTFAYIENKPTNISFRGGLLQRETQENILQYSYDLPQFNDEGEPLRRRSRGEDNIRLDTVPVHKRLIIPNLKDIQGHWAEESIFTLYSLEIFDDKSPYFGPNLPMTRREFAKAVVRAITTLDEEDPKKTGNSRNQAVETSIFEDLDVGDEDYKYIKFAKEKGIMEGVNKDMFLPQGVLTRAQAITILIRALGLEGLAPAPPYKTRFSDDDVIPLWAKDSIYVASEIGLLTGDGYNRVNPNSPMTKAEAATFIYRFIKHIKDDITVDYREKIINSY